ncbi:tRNA-dihydrouridine synthase [Candidatus Pacearchaeota archaeon]|nr:tRNA-dihydrouridine synthase [Candidatus Pacearchaeota archaeon]
MNIIEKPLKIGKIKIPNRIFLAPMVDVTDAAYREICRSAGAGMSYIEMLNIGAILHTNPKTQNLMKTFENEYPKAIQITGKSVEEFKDVLPFLKNYDLIDLNCGCPSIRTIDNESGASLLKDPEKIVMIIKMLKKTKKTVTAKIRLGYKNNNVLEIAKAIEKAGADALTVHARLAWHSNKIPADWEWIKRVKESVKIPVIGNGDIDSPEKAELMCNIADGAMIARAAIGNPFLFKQIFHYSKTRKDMPFNFKENLSYFQEYLRLIKKYDIIDLPRAKYIGTNFFRNIKGASQMRQKLMTCRSYEDISDTVEGFSKANP